MKKIMESFIADNGLKDTDTIIDGVRYFLIAPNRFGAGYIRVIVSDTERYTANLSVKHAGKVGKVQRY